MKPKVPEFVTGKRVGELLEYSFESKINYINSLKGTVHKAIVETSHNLNALKIRDGKKVVHAVSDNFLHCVVLIDDGKEIPSAGSEVDVEIVSPLVDEIKRNGEQEVLARLT